MRACSIFLVFGLILSGPLPLEAQVYKSAKGSFHLNNTTKKQKELDKTPPEITIMSLKPDASGNYRSEEEELHMTAKTTDEYGINYVAVNSKIVEVTEQGLFMVNMNLREGPNEINIISVDENNNLSRKNISVEYKPRIVTFAEQVLETSTYYGLFIGIDDYKDRAIADLDNPIRDAKRLHDVLTTYYTFEPENVQFLKNPTREDIVVALDLLSRTVTSNDNLLIFYAGHGYWDKTAMVGSWLPSDARQDSRTAWMLNSSLVDYLRLVPSKHTLLITDACFSGAIFKEREAFSDASMAIEKLYGLKSRNAMTSGTLEAVPDESAFIKYLVENLENNPERYISSEQLFSSFKIAVINNSAAIPQFGDIQNVGDEGGDFIFIKRQ